MEEEEVEEIDKEVVDELMTMMEVERRRREVNNEEDGGWG